MTKSFARMSSKLIIKLLATTPFNIGEWQAMDVGGSPAHATYELLHETIRYALPPTSQTLKDEVQPDLPWADQHFQERVCGLPLNPAPSHVDWPWAVGRNDRHIDAKGKFDHTYPERYWPKYEKPPSHRESSQIFLRHGIRFTYGDLDDVVNQLAASPYTRQAYLPVWFPEDTGAVDGQRVPCSLGYHFIIREGRLDIVYYIRSCDILRHYTNDVYFTARLAQWMVIRLKSQAIPVELVPGNLVMHITSLHGFVGDLTKLHDLKGRWGRA